MATKPGVEVKVGIFVFIVLIALGYMTTKVSKGKFVTGDMYNIEVFFDNVSGLKKNSPVEIAGIEVGLVKDIVLENGRARVTLALSPDVRIHADAVAAVRTRGVLGDKFVELRSGTERYPVLQNGDRIGRTEALVDMDKLFQKVGQIADDIGKVARSVANVVGGPEGEQDLRLLVQNLKEMAIGLNKMVQTNMESVNLIVANFREFSKDLKDISGGNKKGIEKIISNFEVASVQLKTTLDKMNSLLDKAQNGEGPVARLISDKEMGDDLKKTLASLKSVSQKIDQGKGTLGKLVNDDTTGKELDKTLEGLNKYLAKQEQFRTSVDFHSEYMSASGDTKSYLTLKLQPGEDKYYLLSIVDDPKGRTKTTDTYRRYRDDGGVWHTYEEEESITEKDGLKFSVQIAKRWHDLVIRGGIIESSGGLGLDYYLWDDRIQLFMDAFDFSSDAPPHLKAGGKLFFLKNFYAIAGMDDFISDTGDSSFFAGLGLYFTDEDIKYLLSSVPIPQK
ncbi:MCE family protein [Desulfohalobiaceae bacterium Ax17]|jgi:phospholipid/cholesterol/gamma-HCH transport system substrate-binding protein|uniref:MlaD family protein n=1 Tax=Desulfovulcanus ferrireducens TaxID=2831190 RepID=UPI00207BB3BC|nr:MlaD family protein [Desulfovulcanus ferrireducens]MBT8763706.1 MCE family protein [Desulfovulcanus ferrireducens]